MSPTTIEATDSAGQTSWQRLLKVQLPMARKTIIVGLNQTTMAALSMATIASYVDGPGLGKPVLAALSQNDVGGAFVPGMLIVVMAIMLDRTTTAASERVREGRPRRRRQRPAPADRARRSRGVAALVAVCCRAPTLGRRTSPRTSSGTRLADAVDRLDGRGSSTSFGGVTGAFKDFITDWLLNPMQSLLAESPWWLAGLAIVALAFVFGGLRALVPTVLCLAGIWFFDLWHDAMITLNMTLVATVLVMVLALVFGVLDGAEPPGRPRLRPLLDAGQTIPPFVYLIPVLALFGPTRFTAIVAGVIYAAPAAIKLVADGVKGVSPTTDRGLPLHRGHDLAGDHQGPAADGPRLARAGRQPGPALRARHGGHRRPGRRRGARLRRRPRLLPHGGVGQGRRRPASRSCCSGS